MNIGDYQLPYCTITGTFVAVDADSPDEGAFPDVQPLNGTITLTPTTSAGRVDDAFAQILPVTVRVFGGQIVDDEDLPGVRILATDANIGVADWAWRATFEFDGLHLDPLTFKAPRDTTVNLTSGLVPIKSQPYQIIEGASIVDSESDTDAGLIRFKLSDGTYTRWVPGVGEKGDKGDPGAKGDRGGDGVAATITMGSVTAGANADMWMTGTPQARELHAVLPRGLKGDRGDIGPAGVRGPAGPSVKRTAPGRFVLEDATELTDRLAALEYSTGPRRLPTLDNGWTGDVRAERNGRFVTLAINGINGSSATSDVAFTLPTGLLPSPSLGLVRMVLHVANGSGQTSVFRGYMAGNTVRITGGQGLASTLYAEPLTFLTNDRPPVTPPWNAA